LFPFFGTMTLQKRIEEKKDPIVPKIYHEGA